MNAMACKRGLGLCLSGGGFRASFYHVGVLARMAELDMLKHVEVLSTVSGGSIVGAAYYLKLKRLLEAKPDGAIQRDDYIRLVAELERHFLRAVQKNLRMRTFSNPWKNLRMAWPNYSRSDAIGELYEKYIYRPLIDIKGRRIYMDDLLITPAGHEPGTFHPCNPDNGNHARANKVPILIVNATSLNTGHNWYFSATSMGEVPPRNLNFRDIDKKDRYRRVRYDQITTRNPRFSVGDAVAASAGVPGLFPPMAVSNLYKERRVQLVDGGVFDNQGISGALDVDHTCAEFVVSDASGQSDANDNPDSRLISVLFDSSSILMGRVREEMVNNLEQTRTGHAAYFHLTRGLFARDIEFNEQPVSNSPGVKMSAGIISSEQDFAVTQETQRALAHIRTDLDSFTDAEALSLAADGYRMSGTRLKHLPSEYVTAGPVSQDWLFTACLPRLAVNNGLLLKHLRIGSHRFFKPVIHMLHGTSGIMKSMGLVAVSLPFLISIAAIIFLINLLLIIVTSYSLWQILTLSVSPQFMSNCMHSLYIFLILLAVSLVADKHVEGGGKWALRIRKLLKSPMALLGVLFVRLLLPVLLAIPVALYVRTINEYYVQVMGKLR